VETQLEEGFANFIPKNWKKNIIYKKPK
jgi:hypothetical protein